MTGFDYLLRRRALPIICGLGLTFASVMSATAHESGTSPATAVVMGAAKQGFPLNSGSTDVTGNVSVEAVLIPASVAKTVFGKEVSNHYAIIVLTVSNRSSDDSFIAHTVFIDYSQWLLSGSSKKSRNILCTPSEQSSEEDQNQKVAPSEQTHKCTGNALMTWQQQTYPDQINSVETRIVRGELLDRQPWTTRNWVLRALQAAGSIAAGFTFATNNDSWIRGIAAYNAHVMPAAQTFWPDPTIDQMNRISDFGFQVNKAIAKQSSDIIAAFFPIDRFLTPGLREIFLQSPAVFFSPYATLLDPKHPKSVDQILDRIFAASEVTGTTDQETATFQQRAKQGRDNFMQHLPDIAGGACNSTGSSSEQKAGEAAKTETGSSTGQNSKDAMEMLRVCAIAELLNRTSLNTVRVIVGGSMTVDVNKVPPQITEVDVDVPAGKSAASMWTTGASLTGVIRGGFLGGGIPTVTNIDGKIVQVKGVTEGSNDTELHFTMTLASSLPSGTSKLTFQVSKPSSAGATVKSSTYDYAIPASPAQGGGGAAAQTGGPSSSASTDRPPDG